jgi:hypothetical protein
MKRINFSSFFVAVLILLCLFCWNCGGDGGSAPLATGPTGGGDNNPLVPTADSLVAEWNETAMSLGPTIGTHMASRILAMMHTAMYDAVMAFEGGYTSYYVSDLPPEGASQRAAAAAAAYHVLYTMYTPDDQRATIQALYDEHLAQIDDGQGKNDGIDFGQNVAQAIMMLRSTDGAMHAMMVAHPDGTEPGEWRRTGSGEPMAPGWGEVTPWAMISGDQFDQGGPPALNSPEYTAAYNEVLEFGGKDSLTRTVEQSHLAMFWNPHVPAKWNSLARDIAQREQLSLTDSARLFALLSVTLGDTAISGWNMKYKYSFWRPVTAIQLGDEDTNDLTDGDPLWEPYLMTPPFPEYVSGHSLTCAAAATVLARYLGTDDYNFELRTMGIPEPRTFNSLWQAAEEAGISRIYGGIHFQFANEDGLTAGAALGNYVFDNFFTPND